MKMGLALRTRGELDFAETRRMLLKVPDAQKRVWGLSQGRVVDVDRCRAAIHAGMSPRRYRTRRPNFKNGGESIPETLACRRLSGTFSSAASFSVVRSSSSLAPA